MLRRNEIPGQVLYPMVKDLAKGVTLTLPYIRPISCRIAVADADLAQHRVFLRKVFNHTVAPAVIYCKGSLPNGAAEERGEERRGFVLSFLNINAQRRKGESKHHEDIKLVKVVSDKVVGHLGPVFCILGHNPPCSECCSNAIWTMFPISIKIICLLWLYI